MSALSFSYQGRAVRTAGTPEEPLFVAADVCAVLDIERTSDAISRLDADEKGAVSIRTPGGDQKMLAVTESGLYSLILMSRKPEAKAFKRWMTHEVLPAIRKTGRYEVKRQATRQLRQGPVARWAQRKVL
jgi:anti-repressor protein